MIIILKWPESMSTGKNCKAHAERILLYLPLYSLWILRVIFGSLCQSKCTTVSSIPPKKGLVCTAYLHTLSQYTHTTPQHPSASSNCVQFKAAMAWSWSKLTVKRKWEREREKHGENNHFLPLVWPHMPYTWLSVSH